MTKNRASLRGIPSRVLGLKCRFRRPSTSELGGWLGGDSCDLLLYLYSTSIYITSEQWRNQGGKRLSRSARRSFKRMVLNPKLFRSVKIKKITQFPTLPYIILCGIYRFRCIDISGFETRSVSPEGCLTPCRG